MFFILGNYVFSGEYPQINYFGGVYLDNIFGGEYLGCNVCDHYTLLNNVFGGVYICNNVFE